MQINHPSPWKVLLVVFIFSATLARAEKAHAYVDPYTAGVAVIVAAVVTYATVKATICTPVAVVNAWDHAGGFGGAFKDCWNWPRASEQPASQPTAPSDQPASETENNSSAE